MLHYLTRVQIVEQKRRHISNRTLHLGTGEECQVHLLNLRFKKEAPMGTQKCPFYILPKYQLIKVSAQKRCCSKCRLKVVIGNELTSVAGVGGKEEGGSGEKEGAEEEMK